MVPSTVVVKFSNTCMLQNVYMSKDEDSLVFSTIKSAKTCLKKRLSKVIPHFNNAVIDEDACTV